MKDYEEFFEKHGKSRIESDYLGIDCTVENLYQAIKDRLKDELKVGVPTASTYGKLFD